MTRLIHHDSHGLDTPPGRGRMTKLRVLLLIDQLYSPDGGTEQQLVGLLLMCQNN